MVNKYVIMMRLDHWIKQFFIVPGIIFAYVLSVENKNLIINLSWYNILCGFISTSLIASANYEINEFLDKEFDRFHPYKKNRTAVNEYINPIFVWAVWLLLCLVGLLLAYSINISFFNTCVFLLIMGLLYNIRPVRTKDIAFLDVLTESVNNAIRLLLGWFIVSENTFPPCSLVLGYWMAGAFLMATKRFSEYRMINNSELAGQYRKSFKMYSEKSLLLSAFFYAMSSVFFTGIFLIKYRIELLIFVPALCGLFCYYFWLAFEDDSAAQRPEKLYREKGLMEYCFILLMLFLFCMVVDVPLLKIFTSNTLINF